MTDIVAVLVVPADGDPSGLLADGVCGASVPKVGLRRRGWAVTALVLWWDGALVPEGWDRARRVLWSYEKDTRLVGWDALTAAQVITTTKLATVLAVATALVEGTAKRVVTLTRNVDGDLVEIT